MNQSEIQGSLSFKFISFCEKQCSKLAALTQAASRIPQNTEYSQKTLLEGTSTLWNVLEVIHNPANDLLWFLNVLLGSFLITKVDIQLLYKYEANAS
jgi:hypothetical protein